MDFDQARTFLAVAEAGSFVEAAKRIFVTQSTVSMRIKALEQRLGKTLFERSKAGATMTPAGAQFQRHALAVVRIWQQARLEISLPEGFAAALTVGGQYSLWHGFLLEWLARMRAKAPDVAVRTQMGFSDVLMQGLVDGTLDLGVMYTPQSRPGFEVEMLFEEELVLVSSEPRPPSQPGNNYMYNDWGPEFRADHGLNFPELSTPSLYMELGSLSLTYLLENRASGYFPRRLVAPHLASGALKLVPRTPVFHYPAYAVYPTDGEAKLPEAALRNLRKIAAAQQAG
jgi:DNA-binding transcriptional LysR family regulator